MFEQGDIVYDLMTSSEFCFRVLDNANQAIVKYQVSDEATESDKLAGEISIGLIKEKKLVKKSVEHVAKVCLVLL